MIENLVDETREDYLLNVRKAIVDFVLVDNRKSASETVQTPLSAMPPHRAEIAKVRFSWVYLLYCTRTNLSVFE